uniref:RING-type domain-containing protein n=1 Tax=viral metagenome TaxID=1070528 RepID=A0A6C0H8J1_9ZZZZ
MESEYICIFNGNIWILANVDQRNAFRLLINSNSNYIIFMDSSLNKQCTISRVRYNSGIYIDDEYLIGDFYNVQVFLDDNSDSNWYPARETQAWAYFTYLQRKQAELYFHSKDSINIPDYSIELPFTYLSPNIYFKIKRNLIDEIMYIEDNNDDLAILISDHEGYRNYFLESYYNSIIYNRLATSELLSQELIFPTDIKNIEINETNNNKECIICYSIQWNIKYSCGHFHVCLNCSKNIYEHNSELKCPLCNKIVNKIIKYVDE